VAAIVGMRTRKENDMTSSILDRIRPPGWLKGWNSINGQRKGADNSRTYAIDAPASERPVGTIALSGADETQRTIGVARRPSQHGR
jgi:hypothetical protein